jgi:soluble lytic murein transglycosylase
LPARNETFSRLFSGLYAVLSLGLRIRLLTPLLILSVTPLAGALEPFTAWAEGVGSAAIALSGGDPGAALEPSRQAAGAITLGESGGRARLLAGLALAGLGRPAEAAAEIGAALPSLPVNVAPGARVRLADALSAGGHPGQAAEAFAEAAAGGDPADRVRLACREARARLAAGQLAESARAAATGSDAGDPACRTVLARAWLALGDPRAVPALRDLAVERAGTPEGEEAAASLQSAVPPVALPLPDRLARARRLLAAARPREALELVDAVDREVGSTPLPTVLRAVAMLQLGRPAEAERLATPVAKLPGPGEPAAARYVLARATARQGRLDEAIGWYRRVAAERPVVPGLGAAQQADLPDDAAFLVAWLPYDAGRFAESVAPLRRFARDHPNARRAPDARWFSAWALLRAGDVSGARAAFRSLSTKETGSLRAAALYWQGRIQPSAEEAAPHYRGAIVEAPAGWYALLSAARLAASGEPLPTLPPLPPTPPPEPPRDPRVAASLDQVVDLAGAGLRAESAALLQRLSRSPDARGRASLLAEVGAFVGDPEVPYRMARDHLPPGIRAERWAYPDAHASVLEPAARALGVDPALALAVMRRESAFVSGARSGAAAEGVLQLRAETAHRLLAILGVSGAPDLADPAENLRLGIAYLALLTDRFQNPAAVLAAYNAGPAAAAGWTPPGSGVPLDEWVEDVAYRETRQYVRGVMADWARYRRLRGEAPLAVVPTGPVPPPGPGVAF